MIDNKTKAAVLREHEVYLRSINANSGAALTGSRANELDPSEKPIHPHGGCEGMVVRHKSSVNTLTVFYTARPHSIDYRVPREASKIPAFMCDGTQPDWVKDNDMVWFYTIDTVVVASDIVNWQEYNGMHFCVLNPVEVE